MILFGKTNVLFIIVLSASTAFAEGVSTLDQTTDSEATDSILDTSDTVDARTGKIDENSVDTQRSDNNGKFAVEEKQPSVSDLQNDIEEATRKLSHEPSLHQLKEAALQLADADIEGASRWKRKPQLSAMLPTVKVTTDYDMGRDEQLDRYQEKPDRWGADTDRSWGFQVTAQWHLNELVFHPDELKVYNALSDRASRREALLNLLVGYYFERRRLLLESLLIKPETIEELIERDVRVGELTALIDALTGGLLSRKLLKRTAILP